MPMNPKLLRPRTSSQPAAPSGTPASLLLHFDGTNGSTSFVDSSPNGLTVTGEGDAEISTAESKWGGSSLYLPNPVSTDSDRLVVDDAGFAFGASDWTVEAWVFPLVLRDWITICGTRPDVGGYADGFGFFMNGSGQIGIYSDGFDAISTGGDVVDSQWQHVAVSRSGGDLRVFVNGEQVAHNDTFSKEFTRTTLGVGQFSGSPSEGFSGYIDDLRIVKGLAVYGANGNFTPPTGPLSPYANPQ